MHRRIAAFLRNTLADAATLRLAHAASWLDADQTLQLEPAAHRDPESVMEGYIPASAMPMAALSA